MVTEQEQEYAKRYHEAWSEFLKKKGLGVAGKTLDVQALRELRRRHEEEYQAIREDLYQRVFRGELVLPVKRKKPEKDG